jgi:hypothetical protein
MQTMPQLQLDDVAGAFKQLGCTATGLRRLQSGAGVIVELSHSSQKSLCLGKRIVVFRDLELRVYEHRSRTNQPEALQPTAAEETQPQPQPQPRPQPQSLAQEQTTAAAAAAQLQLQQPVADQPQPPEPDVFSEVAALMRKDAVGTALALLTLNSVAPHTELLRRLILESNLTAPTIALLIGHLAANCDGKTRAAIDDALRRAFSEARSLAVSSQQHCGALQHQQRYVATTRLVGELRLLMVLNDDAALAILSPMRTAAPPTVPDATALIELFLQVLPRMPSICDTLTDCVALADRFSTAPLLPQQLRVACGGSSKRIKFASVRVLAPNAPPQCAPVAVAPAAPQSPAATLAPPPPAPPVAAPAPQPQPQPSPQPVPPPVDATSPSPSTSIASVTSTSTDLGSLYGHVFGAELASACGETLRAARVDRDVLTALAGFEQSECVSMLTKSVGVSAGHAILMARALYRWKQ